jgi:hypothetical protein
LVFDIIKLIKCEYRQDFAPNGKSSNIMSAFPASGYLWVTENSPDFITGKLSLRGKDNGRYPYRILEMIDRVFGPEKNTIEVCSYSSKFQDAVTVDINPEHNPDYVDDAQTLSEIEDGKFNRWRCDPPYNIATAKSMYNTELPSTSKLLQAGARVCK